MKGKGYEQEDPTAPSATPCGFGVGRQSRLWDFLLPAELLSRTKHPRRAQAAVLHISEGAGFTSALREGWNVLH